MDPSQNPASSFYIDPGENPAAILVSPPLNGNNYHSWARAMKRAITSKNKFPFLDGSISMPDRSDPSFHLWQRCNCLLHCWLLNSVSPSIARCIVYTESAAEVWKDLKEMFSQGDLVRVAELQQELYSFKQNSISVTEYIKELKVLWEELEEYRPVPDCVCAIKCACEATRILKMYRQQDCIIQFLTGLNHQYAVVKSKILLMDPLPTLNKVFSMVLQHEREYGLCPLEESHALVNPSDGKRYKGKGAMNSSFKQCTYCGKTGHRIETCYRKHGFPPRFTVQGRLKGGSTEKQPVPVFTHDEYKALLGLLQKANLQKSSTESQAGHSMNQVHVGGKYNKSSDQYSCSLSINEGPIIEEDWFG